METTPAYEQGLTFEKVWAAIQATGEQLKETDRQLKEQAREMDRWMAEQAKEADRQLKEQAREADRRMAERAKENDRRIAEMDQVLKETSRRMGEFSNRFGEVVEYMMVPHLVERFQELNFTFTRTHRNTKIEDRKHDIFLETDAYLENGDAVMVVEIKNKPSIQDIDEHVKRMEKLRAHADIRNDQRKYFGAIAGVIVGGGVRNYTFKNGFYLIEPSGETLVISVPQGKYAPRAW
jgi:predicted RNase H-related nuclease YkuK (DUF458 family)